MGENSKISWCHHSFNGWVGCTKVSPGCKFCYAENLMNTRMNFAQWGDQGTRVRTSIQNWNKPLAWNKKAQELNEKHRVFSASLSDVFEDRPDLIPYRKDLFALIDKTPHLNWLLLTKRPENIIKLWLGNYRENVWLGTSVENQAMANLRIPFLMQAKHLAPITFLSMEPLLESVDITNQTINYNSNLAASAIGVDWVIVGGESGSHARPMNPAWVQSLKQQTTTANVKFFFKQWGEWVSPFARLGGIKETLEGEKMFIEGVEVVKVGKINAGELIDNQILQEIPD